MVVLSLGLFAGAASAHIEPDPPAIQSGTAANVTFNVEHGCGDSPTVSLQYKIPAGVTDAKAVPPAGWTGTQDATSVSFTGGSLAPHTPGDFEISFTAPTAAGSISWLIVQKCTVGEIDWFDAAVAGQPEPENPAPVITITAGPPTSDDLAVAPDGNADAGAATSTVGATATTASTLAPIRDSPGSGHAGLIILIIVVVVIIAGGAYVATRRPQPPSSSSSS